MKFIFVESFSLPNRWNGRTHRDIAGLSGTHAASIYLAEALVALGHEARFISPNILPGIHRGVSYESVDSTTVRHCDAAILTYNGRDIEVMILAKISCTKIYLYMGNPWFPIIPFAQIAIQFPSIKLAMLNVSEFQRVNCLYEQAWTGNVEQVPFSNSLDVTEIPPPLDWATKGNRFVFFACFERGGHVAFEVAKHFPGFQFVGMNYTCGTDVNKFRTMVGSDPYRQLRLVQGGRLAVLEALRQCKFFIYPLVNPDGQVHYDTFGYVVLEALLCGVIVIAPRMSCYEELFGEAVAYIDVSDLLTLEERYRWDRKLPVLGSRKMIDRYVAKVIELESDPTLRQLHLNRGLALREQYSHLALGQRFIDHVSSSLPLIHQWEQTMTKVYEPPAASTK